MYTPTVKEQEYVAGLELFLGVSHEDILTPEAIIEQLPKFAPDFLKHLQNLETQKILDVGSGNGNKAIYLARKLRENFPQLQIIIDSLEPKLEQQKKLFQNYRSTSFLGQVFAQTLASASLSTSYDLVIVLHSLYEFPRGTDEEILSLERLQEIMAPHGCCVIATEHPDGDFQKMKRELYPKFGKKSPLSLSLIVANLEKAQISYQIGDIIDYNSPLNHLLELSDNEIGKQLAFLFSDSLEDDPLKNEQYTIVGQWVRHNHRVEDELVYLHTPDVLVWIYPR
ncbi:class I SAM-dependent methyltransferase [Richelia sinica]|nr:class I SAM-dependent methyltransferase [Richelia sinica]MBD2665333.1 hypothetical protein [Richelia sinica FACHB-800]